MRNEKAIQLFALILFVSAFAGCASSNSADAGPGIDQTIPGATKWGHYDGEPVTKWNPDGRTMTLLTELRYTDPHGEVWVAPIGSVVDGASIPRYLWSVMGGPFEGKYRNASVLHDVAYGEHKRPWQDCDRMFYYAMNPARSLAPAVVSQHVAGLWIYLVAPTVGALLAVVGCRCVREEGCCSSGFPAATSP